jgi:hypothetical protein
LALDCAESGAVGMAAVRKMAASAATKMLLAVAPVRHDVLLRRVSRMAETESYRRPPGASRTVPSCQGSGPCSFCRPTREYLSRFSQYAATASAELSLNVKAEPGPLTASAVAPVSRPASAPAPPPSNPNKNAALVLSPLSLAGRHRPSQGGSPGEAEQRSDTAEPPCPRSSDDAHGTDVAQLDGLVPAPIAQQQQRIAFYGDELALDQASVGPRDDQVGAALLLGRKTGRHHQQRERQDAR